MDERIAGEDAKSRGVMQSTHAFEHPDRALDKLARRVADHFSSAALALTKGSRASSRRFP